MIYQLHIGPEVLKMKNIINYIFISFLIFSVNSAAAPCFNCQKAKTNVEKTICQNKVLNDLDNALDIIYKKAHELSPNKLQIKLEQEAWLRNRNYQATIGKPEDLKYRLNDVYGGRIFELLKDQNLRYFLLKKFINSPFESHHLVSILAIMSQIEENAGKPLWLNVRANMIIEPLIMPITRQIIIVALMINREQYRREYVFSKISYTGQTVNVERFNLPQPKTIKLPFVGEQQNSITGDFNLTKQNGKYLLSYYVRPSKDVKGEGCIWQIDEEGIKVFKEIQCIQ